MSLTTDCGCDENLEAELQAKQDAGEELTADEREFMQQGKDALPTFGPTDYQAFGPLSSYDGTHCAFCFWVGILSSLFVGAALAAAGHLAGLPGGVVPGVGLGVVLVVAVLYFGHLPVVGPNVGPVVERALATVGIYPTAKAKQRYMSEDTTAETENESDDNSGIFGRALNTIQQANTPGSSDTEPETNGHDKNINVDAIREEEQAKVKARQKEQEAQSLKEEKESWKEEAQQKEERIKELKQQNQEVREQYRLIADPDHATDKIDAYPVIIWSEDGTSALGLYYYTGTVELDANKMDQEYQDGVYAIVVPPAEIGQLGNLPDTIVTQSTVEQFEDYLYPDPRKVTVPPQHVDPGKPAANISYEYQEVEDGRMRVPLQHESAPTIFFNSAKGIREERNNNHNFNREDGGEPMYIGRYTIDGKLLPAWWDPNGFESRNELRESVRSLETEIESLRSYNGYLENEQEALQEKLQSRREDYEELLERLNDRRDDLGRALDMADEVSHDLQLTERQLEQARKEKRDLEELAEGAAQSRDQERRQRLLEENDTTMAAIEAQADVNDRLIRFLNVAETANYGDYDYDAIRAGTADTEPNEILDEVLGAKSQVNDLLVKAAESAVKDGVEA
ncbi:hypothetical protein [Haloglomus salinum]|uniref:hypothetical protein n=1 Tax=Haloglomus salinum TaxID=2962673 RepID=UPI0020C9E1BB|nr:hypothetical protein [Haloglomus salinum]